MVANLAGVTVQGESALMFAMMTAQVKLLYWSILVYEYEEASVTDDELKADLRDQTLEVSLPCYRQLSHTR